MPEAPDTTADADGAVEVRARPTVVIVDDTAALRLLLRVLLDQEGFEVVGEAGDGHAGLELLRELRPDLAIVDLAMPVLDGLQVLEQARADGVRTRVLVYSGFASERMRERSLRAGAVGYVEKGHAPARLVEAAREALGLAGPGDATATAGARPAPASPVPAGGHAVTDGGPATPEVDEVESAFAAMCAHELRTPLASVRGLSSMLVERWDQLDDATRRSFAEQVDGEAERMASLVEHMLTIARLDNGVWSAEPETLRLRRTLSDIAEREGLTLPDDLGDDVLVRADPDYLSMVIGNFVANARRHGRPPLHVAVRAGSEDVSVEIVDAGPGVPAELEPHLFERFARGRTGIAASTGTGLGLYIARRLAEAQRAEVYHRRVEPSGTAFGVRMARG